MVLSNILFKKKKKLFWCDNEKVRNLGNWTRPGSVVATTRRGNELSWSEGRCCASVSADGRRAGETSVGHVAITQWHGQRAIVAEQGHSALRPPVLPISGAGEAWNANAAPAEECARCTTGRLFHTTDYRRYWLHVAPLSSVLNLSKASSSTQISARSTN